MQHWIKDPEPVLRKGSELRDRGERCISYVDRWNGVILNCPHGTNVSSNFLSNVSLIITIKEGEALKLYKSSMNT